jgi:hypothetical protein
VRQLRAERTQLEMHLVVARVAAAGAVANETSARVSLEAARQSMEDRAISAETTTAAAVTERDSLASRLVLAESEIENSKWPQRPRRRRLREQRSPQPRRRPLHEKPPRPLLVRRCPSRQRCWSWRVT